MIWNGANGKNSSRGNKLLRKLIPQDPQLMSAQRVVPVIQKKLALRFERMNNQQLGPAVENRDQPISNVFHGADVELVSVPIKRKSNKAMEFTRIVDFFHFFRKPKVSTEMPEEQAAVQLIPIGAKPVELEFSRQEMDLILQVVENLKSLNSTTEADFLLIGGNLQDFFQQAKALDQTGEMAAGLLSGKEISESVQQLVSLAMRISRMLEVSKQRQKYSLVTVDRVAFHIRKVARTVNTFEDIAKSMRMMGITTRIESANLTQGSRIFQAFANQILQKSASIESKVDQITTELLTQGRLIAGNVEKLLNLSEKHQNQGQTVIKALGRVFKQVTDISGATILGDGSVALIMDLNKLLHAAEIEGKFA